MGDFFVCALNFDTEVLHFRKCSHVSTPHLLFLWLVKEKEDAPLGGGEEKESALSARRWIGTAYQMQ